MIRNIDGIKDMAGTRGGRAFVPAWLAIQLAIAAACGSIAVFVAQAKGFAPPHVAFRPVIWGVVAALVHSLLGLVLLESDPAKRRNCDERIRSGLFVLALRYFTGVGLLVAGLFAFPPFRTLCVTSWLGTFVILTLSELIVFVKGVHRL